MANEWSSAGDANFTPEMGETQSLRPFAAWCQWAIPAIYNGELSYYELLTKLVWYINTLLENVNTLEQDITALRDAFVKLQDYVNNYLTTLNFQQLINNKLDEMAASGELSELMQPYLQETRDLAKAAQEAALAAQNQATASANSAAQAANSATNANQQATNAANSAASANQHATDAANSAASANQHATDAANSATNANQQATNAANSAASANQQATNAANSAANANQQATNAANSAQSSAEAAERAEQAANEASGDAAGAANALTQVTGLKNEPITSVHYKYLELFQTNYKRAYPIYISQTDDICVCHYFNRAGLYRPYAGIILPYSTVKQEKYIETFSIIENAMGAIVFHLPNNSLTGMAMPITGYMRASFANTINGDNAVSYNFMISGRLYNGEIRLLYLVTPFIANKAWYKILEIRLSSGLPFLISSNYNTQDFNSIPLWPTYTENLPTWAGQLTDIQRPFDVTDWNISYGSGEETVTQYNSLTACPIQSTGRPSLIDGNIGHYMHVVSETEDGASFIMYSKPVPVSGISSASVIIENIHAQADNAVVCVRYMGNPLYSESDPIPTTATNWTPVSWTRDNATLTAQVAIPINSSAYPFFQIGVSGSIYGSGDIGCQVVVNSLAFYNSASNFSMSEMSNEEIEDEERKREEFYLQNGYFPEDMEI